MKLLYIFLAHNRPEALVELASTLVQASSDAHAYIHFDLGASPDAFETLTQRASTHERLHLVQRRVRCQWGSWTLVEPVLNAILEARSLGVDFDYVLLLSGDCYPSKPIRHLETYLQKNAGKEFIECHDDSWIVGGLRTERYRFWFPIPPRPYGDSRTLRFLIWMQRRLRVRRKVPGGMGIRFGSQWWALTWMTCIAVLELMERNPNLLKFFRTVYIPDEMVFPTLVHHLVGEHNIAGYGLTHYQFTNMGRPVVYYDDHGTYPLTTRKFFVRKLAPEAHSLRERCLRIASTEKLPPRPGIGVPSTDYQLKVKAQSHYPVPGQIFYGDQIAAPGGDVVWGVMHAINSPYLVLCGGREEVRDVLRRLPAEFFQTFGFLFRPQAVGLGPGIDSWQGLHRGDWKMRDMHPALYLARVRQRVPEGKVSVFGWSPGDGHKLLQAVCHDGSALVLQLPCRLQENALEDLLLDKGNWIRAYKEEHGANAESIVLLSKNVAELRDEPWLAVLTECVESIDGRKNLALRALFESSPVPASE